MFECSGLVLLFLASCRYGSNPTADLILRNGVFYTVDEKNSIAEAVAIKNGRFLAVGRNEEISRFQGKKTEVRDMMGSFGCPGFNDAHAHLLEGALSMLEVNLQGVSTEQELRRRILPTLYNLPPNAWLIGRGWDQTLFEKDEMPTLRMLDRISEYTPIVLTRICGRVALANSKALKIAGIDQETPNPPGGVIVKDPVTGLPTGLLMESAMKLVSQYVPKPSDDMILAALTKVLDMLPRFGITSIQENSSQEYADIWEKLDGNRMPCRVTLNFPFEERQSGSQRAWDRLSHGWIRPGFYSITLDGSLGARSAALLQPYADEPSNRGLSKWTQEELDLMIHEAAAGALPVYVSALGDKANQMLLNSLNLMKTLNMDGRFRIEFMEFVTSDDILRLRDFPVVAVTRPAHMLDDMRWIEQRLGNQRTRNVFPLRRINNAAVLAFGSDWPAVPLNPMLGLYAAVTRKDTTGYPPAGWQPQECLSIQDAIRAYTYGSAYADNLETEKGSLEPGKLADMVILDRNVLDVPLHEIQKASVVFTVLGGRIIPFQDENH